MTLSWGESRSRGAVVQTVFLALFVVLTPVVATAAINPWIASSVYDPQKWDSAGPYTATPWLHPPPYMPNQGWGMLDPATAFKDGAWHNYTNFTGGWGGARDDLMGRGIAFSVAYFGQFAANPEGGVDEGGTSWRGDLAVGAFLDLERLANWERTYFNAVFDWKDGTKSLTNRYIGNQFPVQLDNGDDGLSATRLVNLAVGHQMFGNDLEIAAGRVVTGEEFATLRLACTSLNQAVCGNPIAGAQSISFPTFPNAVWGGHVKLKPSTDWMATVGSYLVYADFRNPNAHGTNFSAPSNAGALTMAEFAYFVNPASDAPSGTYKLGGYFDTEELVNVETKQPVSGTGGAYLMGEQTIFSSGAHDDVGLSAWLALSYAPPNRNQITFMAAGGLLYQGIVPSRPWDGIAFIAAYGQYSGDLRDGQRARGEPVQSGEVMLEVNYRFSLASWLWIEPDIQGILQPKGRSDIPDALAIGFAVGAVL